MNVSSSSYRRVRLARAHAPVIPILRPVRIVLTEAPKSRVRHALKVVLEAQNDFQVVAIAGDGLAALAEVERTSPHVALLDVNLPALDSIDAARLMKERVPDTRVVVLAESDDDAALLRAVEAGADGYVTRTVPLADLVEAVRAVSRGEVVVPSRMLGMLLSKLLLRERERADAFRLVWQLTRRQRDVLGLLVRGANEERIARALVISPRTARIHVQNILSKLGVNSSMQAAAFLARNDIEPGLRWGASATTAPTNGHRKPFAASGEAT